MPGQTPILRLPYPLPADALVDYPALGQNLATLLEQTIRQTLAIPRLTPAQWPPANPVDGMLAILNVAAPITWLFRYNANAGGGYPWEFLGGPPLTANLASIGNFTNDGTYQPASDADGPAITVPKTGDYLADFHAAILSGTAGAFGCGVQVQPVVANATQLGTLPAAQGTTLSNVPSTITNQLTGATIRLRYQATAGANAQTRYRALRLWPTRVANTATVLRARPEPVLPQLEPLLEPEVEQLDDDVLELLQRADNGDYDFILAGDREPGPEELQR